MSAGYFKIKFADLRELSIEIIYNSFLWKNIFLIYIKKIILPNAVRYTTIFVASLALNNGLLHLGSRNKARTRI